MTSPSVNQTAAALNAPIGTDVLRVLQILEDFGGLLVKETHALKKSDFKTVDLLQANKRSLAREYQELVSGLSTRKEEMGRIDTGLRNQLVQKRTGFTQILNDNLRALEAAKASTARLVGKILDVARKAVADDHQTHYSSKGKSQSYKTSTRSLAVDTNL
ncbi:MAG: hypothetical protein PW788_15095 [Micavibrio sp.]|nr:hypothetical protein [Micavibrio sp.]